MFATIRRYESIDETRINELVKKTDETFVPEPDRATGLQWLFAHRGRQRRRELDQLLRHPRKHADESTRLASSWVREQELETALPNAPKITSGEVVVHKASELVQASTPQAVGCRREGPRLRAFFPVLQPD